MIRKLLITGFTLFSFPALSQFVPISSQSFQFLSTYNPAFSGIDPFMDIKLGVHYQWAGFQGAPRSGNLSFNMRLKQPLDVTSNALRLSNPGAIKIPRGKLSIHGLSANVFELTYGVINTSGGSVNYSFHAPITKRIYLAIGAGAFIQNTKINYGDITLRDINDTYFNDLKNRGGSRTDLTIRAGVLLYSKSFYFGASYFPVWQTALSDPGGLSSYKFYQGSAQIGYSVLVSPTFYVKPSVLAIMLVNNTFNIDYSVKGFVGDRVWFGLTYRDVKSGLGMLGFNINDTFSVSYSYEMSLGKFKTYNDGTHELVMAVRLNNFRRQPSYAW
jgi:type IX secretion system PorP/SprF family membrane protein